MILEHSGHNKMATILRWQFEMHFPESKIWILIKISLRVVPRGPINNIPSLVQIKAWWWSGDKPLSEPMMFSMFSIPTYICVTRPQWVKYSHWHNWEYCPRRQCISTEKWLIHASKILSFKLKHNSTTLCRIMTSSATKLLAKTNLSNKKLWKQ